MKLKVILLIVWLVFFRCSTNSYLLIFTPLLMLLRPFHLMRFDFRSSKFSSDKFWWREHTLNMKYIVTVFQVTADLMYLLNMVASSHCLNEDTERALSLICHLVFNFVISWSWIDFHVSFYCGLVIVFWERLGMSIWNFGFISYNLMAWLEERGCYQRKR